MSRTPDPPDLPEWAQLEADRAVRFVIHPTDDAFKAEQRRVPAYQKARRQIMAQVQALQSSASKLSGIDRAAVQHAVQPVITLVTEWDRRDKVARVRRQKGRPETAAVRNELFRAIVKQLVATGWKRSVAWNALARFVVHAFPPVDTAGARRNAHIYGALTSGYGKRANRNATREREADWESIPITDRAALAFLSRLRSARTPQRNK